MVAMRKKSPYPYHSSKCSGITHRWINAATSENPAMGYRMVLGRVTRRLVLVANVLPSPGMDEGGEGVPSLIKGE
jgi:hypothetical protein